jgi:hypothetical protein
MAEEIANDPQLEPSVSKKGIQLGLSQEKTKPEVRCPRSDVSRFG